MTTKEYNDCVSMFSDSVYRFVLKSLRESEAARDIVQESFLRLWENRAAVARGKEKSYLFTIAYRLAIDSIRLNGRYTGDYDVAMARHGNGGNSYTGATEMVGRALDGLPELQRNLVLLRDWEGYSYREIAGIANLTETQVKVYIFRARLALKEKLGKIENIL